jgi:hypothetical protein
MSHFFNHISKKTFVAIFALSIFCFEFLLSLQGFDLCDEGYMLTAYQQIFHCPESVSAQFPFYLTLFLGGVWNSLFGFGGILSFRILSCICITGSFLLVYAMLEDVVNRWCIFLGSFIVLLTIDENGILVFHYDYLSAFFYCLIVYFLMKGLSKLSLLNLFIAFGLIGLSVFVRLPNVFFLFLGLLIFIDYAYRKNFVLLKRQILLCFCGFVFGIFLVLLLQLVLGHLSMSIQSVTNTLNVANDSTSTHSTQNLLNAQLDSYYGIAKHICLYGFPILLSILLHRCLKKRILLFLIDAILFLSIILIFLFYTQILALIYAITTCILIYSIYRYRKQEYVCLLCVSSLTIMYVFSVGHDCSFLIFMGALTIWISVPLGIGLFYKEFNGLMSIKHLAFYLILSFFSIFVYKEVCTISSHCYFDPGSRLEKKYLLSNPLATTFTSKEKCAMMDDVLRHLALFVKDDDYLLCFQSTPMVHYLTHTKPYLYNPWIWCYGVNVMEKQMERAKKELPLPVILREKCQPIGGNWNRIDVSFNSTDVPNSYLHNNGRINLINRFIAENGYKIVWENNFFMILVPNVKMGYKRD